MKRLVVGFSLIIIIFVMITEGRVFDNPVVDKTSSLKYEPTTEVVEFEEPRIFQEVNGYWSPCLFGV